jgi:hypothetical protein
MDVYRGNIVLTDWESSLCPAVVVVQDGKVVGVEKNTIDISHIKGPINKVKVYF